MTNHRKPPPPHGDHRRYKYWACRCAPCREASRIYCKRQREGRLTSAYTNPTGSVRRIQGLVAYGYSYIDLGAALGTAAEWPSWLANGRVGPRGVLARTAAQITEACAQLMQLPPPAGRRAAYARTVARRNGWFPLAAWDEIDDPAAVPNLGGSGDGIIDDEAVRRVVAGTLPFTALREGERVALFQGPVGEWTYSRASKHLRMSSVTIDRWRARAAEQVAA